MQVASQGTTLHIDHVELGHAGLFACHATNEAGTAGAEVEVSVHGEQAPGLPGKPGMGGTRSQARPGNGTGLVLSVAWLSPVPREKWERMDQWFVTLVVCPTQTLGSCSPPQPSLHTDHAQFCSVL